MKEYHVWDSIYALDDGGIPPLEGSGAAEREILRAKLAASPELYFDHFANLLKEPGKSITGDITPAYSALPTEAFRRIAEGFAARGVKLKIVFLMRDPVERCWSAARMYRRKGSTVAGLDPAMTEADFVRLYAATPHALRRGRYDQTVTSTEHAIDAEAQFFGFYETLFEPEEVAAMTAFLGIDPPRGFESREFNVSPKSDELSEVIRREIAERYRETLGFCEGRFPESRRLWDSYSLLG